MVLAAARQHARHLDDTFSGAAIEMVGVAHAFGTGAARKPVLSGIDLSIQRGELVILTGPSGAGKTTLMTLVGTLRSLQTGSIRVMGTELAGLSEAERRNIRRKVGFIFQDHNLFDALTAFQTLQLANELTGTPLTRGEMLAKAAELLSDLGMEDHLHDRPGKLSTGQKQRIAIARALINDPPLILADEPTASLDHESSKSVIGLIKRRVQMANATVLMVTHDHRIFGAADRIVHMVDGRIAATS